MNVSSTIDFIDAQEIAVEESPPSRAHTPTLSEIQQVLLREVALQLRVAMREVRSDRPLTEYGLDSIAALTIAGELEELFKVELPSTLLWDCPTIDALASYLLDLVSGRA